MLGVLLPSETRQNMIDRIDDVDGETIEAAIKQHDDPDHPDATSVSEARDALVWLQESFEDIWKDWVNNLERGELELVHEDRDVIVFSTGEENVVKRELYHHYDGDLDDIGRDIVYNVHITLAREITNYDWGYEYPVVVGKTDGINDGQHYVEAVINNLLRRDLSPGQAWAIYGVKIRGNSRNQWAARCGYSDHSAVSEAVRKGLDKLPSSWSDE